MSVATNASGNAVSAGQMNVGATSGPQVGVNFGPFGQKLVSTFVNGATGSTPDQIDLVYAGSYTATASPVTIDLTALADPLGNSWSGVKRVRRLRIRITSTTDGSPLTLSPGTSNGWSSLMTGTSPGLLIHPASANNPAWFEIVAPNITAYAVGSTNKTIKLDPGGATITFEVEAEGCSI